MSNETKSTGQWALVTGAARRIGAEISTALHQRGLQVILHCHGSRDSAAALAARFNAQRPDSARVLQADLTARDAGQELADAVLAITPRLALLVNNASRFYPTPLGTVTGEQWQDLMGSNIKGAFFLSQALAPALQGGAIVNLLDIHAQRPMPGHTVYCMAKAAMAMMTQSMALELAPQVRVNGVSPGAILWPENGGDVTAQEALLARVPMGRCGSAEDIARTVAFLGLDADYITGQVLAVDGGRSLNI